MLSGPPTPDVRVPGAVLALARGRSLQPLWHNELGGLTYRVGDDLVVKWSPPGFDLEPEVARLRWAGAYLRVLVVVDHGSDEEGSWFVSVALPGENAVSDRWKADPRTAVRAVGEGLRALHERLPVADCPFSWSVDARRAGQAGAAALQDAPDVDRLVVCHGDACVPNTMIGADGRWSAHVDLGSLGLADRWADLAVATWSTEWNYGPGWADALLDAYGVAADPERTDYYRRLWDLTS